MIADHATPAESSCAPGHSHHWLARSFGGVGFIEEKVCGNCGLVAKRVPPKIRDGEIIAPFHYKYSTEKRKNARHLVKSRTGARPT
jgi:hypothetical protein